MSVLSGLVLLSPKFTEKTPLEGVILIVAGVAIVPAAVYSTLPAVKASYKTKLMLVAEVTGEFVALSNLA
jgi:hypothetical protein